MPPKGSKAVAKKPRATSKAAAAGLAPSSNTTFLDALEEVPGLALACCSTLDSDRYGYGAGSGLKRLRCVSQGVRAAIQKYVQGYTFKLGDRESFASALDNPQMLAFLNRSQLLRLKISVPPLGPATGEQ